jgi:Zn-finger nucleic acid-binding protein
MTDRHGVTVDHCPTCRGVWLDRGELEKLLELAARSSHRSGRDHPRDHHDDDEDRFLLGGGGLGRWRGGDGGRRRRRGFLDDVFDFD